jgi:hypothetical protein
LPPSLSDVKRRVLPIAASEAHRAELALAARAWYGDDAPGEDWLNFLEFFAFEWLDFDGLTLVERTLGLPLPADAQRWLTRLRHGVFVIDDWADGVAQARDTLNEDALELIIDEPLPARSVLCGRLIPVGQGRYVPSGEPDLYDPLSALRRMELSRTWAMSPRKLHVDHLTGLRRAFAVQREQRAAFIAHFGADELLFEDTKQLSDAISGFLSHLLHEHRPASLEGRTLAETLRDQGGLDLPLVAATVGETLTGAPSVGVIFDERDGISFLPGWREFLLYMNNASQESNFVDFYVRSKEYGDLPFRRGATPARLARHLGVPEAPLDALVAPLKLTRRASPSVLPGFEDWG